MIPKPEPFLKPPPLLGWKWYILLLANLVTFGSYYSYDFPSVLHNQLQRHFQSSSNSPSTAVNSFEFEFSLFYAIYSLPNLILPYIGGILSDRYGNNKVMGYTATLVLIGNVIQTISVYERNIYYMIAGEHILFAF